jgi:hypothetical protein
MRHQAVTTETQICIWTLLIERTKITMDNLNRFETTEGVQRKPVTRSAEQWKWILSCSRNVISFNALSVTLLIYARACNKNAAQLYWNPTHIFEDTFLLLAWKLKMALRWPLFDGAVLDKGDQYGQCLFVVAPQYYNTVRPRRDIGHTGLA